MPYQIRDWNVHFENSRSREIDHCGFVAIPNKQDGLGFARIMAEPDGTSMYGIWCCIVAKCSRQGRPRAGWLTENGKENGRPLDSDGITLALRRQHVGSKEVLRTLEFLSSEDVGWLEFIQLPTDCRQGAVVLPTNCLRTEQTDRTEQTALTAAKTSRGGESITMEVKRRVGALYKRPPDDSWSHLDESLLCEVARRPRVLDELSEIERGWMSRVPFLSQSAGKLLGDWGDNLDKIRTNHLRPSNGQGPKKTAGEKAVDLETSRANKLIKELESM